MATAVTEQSFEEEVLQSDKPVIVDFWAEWCGPCHAVAPVLDKIVAEHTGDLTLGKVNIDEQPALSQRFGVQSIPTMILFKNGEPAAAAIGAQPKPALERALGLAGDSEGYPPSARSFSACGMGETARPAGSFLRVSRRMPCTKTIAPPNQ